MKALSYGLKVSAKVKVFVHAFNTDDRPMTYAPRTFACLAKNRTYPYPNIKHHKATTLCSNRK